MSIKSKIYIGIIIVGISLLLWDRFFARTPTPVAILPQDFTEVPFTIKGEEVTLVDGISVIPFAPGSASVSTIRYFGNDFTHDIDGDGDMDVVFLVTEEGGGSGTFFYVVGAIKEEEGYRGTQAMFLGDRVAPQSISAGDGTQVIVNYSDRAVGEPMSTAPSVGKSMHLLYNPVTNDFGEVVKDFEGESNLPEADKNDLIVVMAPSSGATVTNPINVAGQARGVWYFEASFPLIVVDWDGRIIGEGYAQASNDWMTEDFVPFTGSVSYDLPEDTPYKRGALIFKKDNPSGLPQYDDALEIPILFE